MNERSLPETDGAAVIETRQLTMHFRRCEALTDVDLRIDPGTVFALLGENGAGKTTMIRILTGFQKPTSGECSICGLDPLRQADAVRRRIGYVSDTPSLYDWMTVAQIGGFTASLYGVDFLPSYQQAITRFAIQPEQKIRHLSKGQRAKVVLSLALAHDPELLIMDEPTSGLDPKVRRSFLESMIDRAASGRTVFLSSHQISEVERVADTIAILHRGRVRLQGPLSEIRESISQLVVDLDDPLRALPALPESVELLSEENEGRSRLLYVRHLTPAALHNLRDGAGVVDVRVRTATLEEIFVACTSERSSPVEERVGPSFAFPNP
ncbi:MAG: ABC transporter ATP-binding protein [Planctomycetota bacterium]